MVDSGATYHMCNDREQFVDFKELSNKQEVTLGDGHTLDGTGIGIVRIETLLPDGTPGSADWRKSCMYQNCPTIYSVSPRPQKQATPQNLVELAVKLWTEKGHSICNKSWKPVLLRILSQGESEYDKQRQGAAVALQIWTCR